MAALPTSYGSQGGSIREERRANSSSSEREGSNESNDNVDSPKRNHCKLVRRMMRPAPVGAQNDEVVASDDSNNLDGGCCAKEDALRDSTLPRLSGKELPIHHEQYIDSHCHIDFISARNRSCTLDSLRNEFVHAFPPTFKGCIANFIKPPYSNWNWICKVVKDDQVLGSSWGIHPHYSGAATAESLGSLKQFFIENRELLKIVAIGECGVDLSGKNAVPLAKQLEVFKFQVDMAYELDLPIIIHCREGQGVDNDPEDHILNVLKERPNHPIHRHCFTRDIVIARKWMSTLHNCSFGFTPLVCSSGWFEPLIKHIPLDRVHLETDAPFFVPRQYASFNQLKYSVPGAAITVAVRISEILDLPLDEVIRVTRMCTNRIYRLPAY